jgi:SAM-dependent methyltransferase
VTVTGERVTTPAGGFNPTWQRHVAAYGLCARFLPEGPVLDLGCGVGHSYRLLAPRRTVGVDIEPSVLEGQDRETHVGDMRALPLASGSFASVLAVQSIEHVPEPQRALEEVVRVLRPGGVAVLVTPNRLTFAKPDEIIDPYHYVEYDPAQLRALCAPHFASVEIHGLFGSARYLELIDQERERLDRLLARDPLRLRRLVPRRVRQRLYDRMLTRARTDEDPRAAAIVVEDFRLSTDDLERALDLIAVCRSGG